MGPPILNLVSILQAESHVPVARAFQHGPQISLGWEDTPKVLDKDHEEDELRYRRYYSTAIL
jgi:hypothetical protein